MSNDPYNDGVKDAQQHSQAGNPPGSTQDRAKYFEGFDAEKNRK